MESPRLGEDFVIVSEDDEKPLRDQDSNAHEVVNYYIQMVLYPSCR